MSHDQSPRVHRWSELPVDSPKDLLERRRVVGSEAMLSYLTLHEGFEVGTHRHHNEQFAIVLSGRVQFTLGDDNPETVELVEGEVLHLPPNVPHAARAVETSIVLDVFAPASEATGVDRA